MNGMLFFLRSKDYGEEQIWFIRLVFQGLLSFSLLCPVPLVCDFISDLLISAILEKCRKAEPFDRLKKAHSLFLQRISKRTKVSSLEKVYFLLQLTLTISILIALVED